MNRSGATLILLACIACFAGLGCEAPGKPVHAEGGRPDDVLDFPTLYKQNCAACHGKDGKGGATLPLANPVYLAIAGADNIQRITSDGVAGTSMPPFAKSRGGTLSDKQISVLTKGIIDSWGHTGGSQSISYASNVAGDPANGKVAYATFCARCHGPTGEGRSTENKIWTDSIVDPAYLALVSDQYLRSTIVGGLPDRNMPDWRSDLTGQNARPMTEQEISDTVAWLVTHRVASPGQPYAEHP